MRLITRPLLGGILAGTVGLAVVTSEAISGAAAAAPAAHTIVVMNFGFSPADVRTGLGTRVVWRFKDSVSHTSTSDEGFWSSSPHPSGTSFVQAFPDAGSYGYHCAIHPDMTGTVTVPLAVTGTASTGYTIRWSSLRTTPATRRFDVQLKRPGTTKWVTVRSHTATRVLHFDPARAGTYVVRARTDNLTNHHTSGWSPSRSVKIS